ncbi:MAG: biopolymer transporter ExbD [Planctomycetia bacterium]|nr:biopolymer transporter ExbD [Planctomycetia bacterium]
MAIRFPCPTCGKSLRADATEAGRRGLCKRCGSTFTVPSATLHVKGQEQTSLTSLIKPRPIHVEDLIDMTAMVDVVFFLLIFFLVTSIQSLQSSIELPSPEASKSAQGELRNLSDYESNADYVVVRIEPDDRMLVDDQEVYSEQELRSKLREARASDHPPSGLLVVGHADASHGAAVKAFDAAADVGLKNVRLSVEDDL